MTLQLARTDRGFPRVDFVDHYGAACSLQMSSLATEDAIWLGVNAVTPKVMVPGKGWQNVPMPAEALTSGRMHLTREQVAELLPLLQRFVATGRVE